MHVSKPPPRIRHTDHSRRGHQRIASKKDRDRFPQPPRHVCTRKSAEAGSLQTGQTPQNAGAEFAPAVGSESNRRVLLFCFCDWAKVSRRLLRFALTGRNLILSAESPPKSKKARARSRKKPGR